MVEAKQISEDKLERIKKKYYKKIDKIMIKLKDATISELWKELDRLKAEMEKEILGVTIVEV